MLDSLTTEGRNPAAEAIDCLDSRGLVRLMNAEDSRISEAVGLESESIARAIEIITRQLRHGGRLVYLGAGTSGRLGVLDASECPPTFNTPPGQIVGLIAGGATALTRSVEGAEDHPRLAVADLQALGLTGTDVLVGIATSGRTPYVLSGVEYARSLGTATIGVSCNAGSTLAKQADLAITVVVGPEVISGSTRLKAGTATKMVLNMLTTGTMVLLGKTYGDLMVDLKATNQKLVARSRRIVAALTQLSEPDAERVLQTCNGEVKTAIVVQRRSVTPDVARELLQKAQGQLRRALEASIDQVPAPAEVGASIGPQITTSSLRPPADSLVLGLEGGGTKTRVWLALRDVRGEAAILGESLAGSSNPQVVGYDRALVEFDTAVAAVFVAANLPRQRVAAACIAGAGLDRDDARVRILEWSRICGLAEKVEVVDDGLPILMAGTPAGAGLAVISGTGSIVIGQNLAGERVRSGGWGPLLGDEGSGYRIAIEGLSAVLRAQDGRGQQTILTERFLGQLSLNSPPELIPLIYGSGMDRSALAQLSRTVDLAAEEGDPVACQILQAAAGQLAEMVQAAAAQLQWKSGIPLALSGGVLVNSRLLQAELLAAVRRAGVNMTGQTLVHEARLGVIELARRSSRLKDEG